MLCNQSATEKKTVKGNHQKQNIAIACMFMMTFLSVYVNCKIQNLNMQPYIKFK